MRAPRRRGSKMTLPPLGGQPKLQLPMRAAHRASVACLFPCSPHARRSKLSAPTSPTSPTPPIRRSADPPICRSADSAGGARAARTAKLHCAICEARHRSRAPRARRMPGAWRGRPRRITLLGIKKRVAVGCAAAVT